MVKIFITHMSYARHCILSLRLFIYAVSVICYTPITVVFVIYCLWNTSSNTSYLLRLWLCPLSVIRYIFTEISVKNNTEIRKLTVVIKRKEEGKKERKKRRFESLP
jgi:hypothetical protein